MPAGGYTRTEESKAKNRIAHLGKVASVETRAKMRLAHSHITEETREKRSANAKANWLNPIYRERMISIMRTSWLNPFWLGKKLSAEHGAKIGEANRHRVVTAKTRAKIKANWLNPHFREKVILAQKGKTRSEETRAKMRKNWSDPLFKERQIRAQRRAMSIHPNKPETLIMGMLESICPGEFKFVGDGQVIIAGKNPDFININGHKQIIELFGDYWHGKMVKSYERTEKGRIKLFKQYGFDTLIIWERELKTPDKVAERITNFTKKNCFEGLLKEAA